MRNSRGQIIIDRRFNTAQLMGMYMNQPLSEDTITWNPDNPNQLRMSIPGMLLSWFVYVQTFSPRVGDTSCQIPVLLGCQGHAEQLKMHTAVASMPSWGVHFLCRHCDWACS